jgi:excisionase family DNA binding protein
MPRILRKIDRMKDEIESPLFTESEAARYLRISARNLWQLRKAGKIRVTRIGRKVFYRRENLDQFIAANEPTESLAAA